MLAVLLTGTPDQPQVEMGHIDQPHESPGRVVVEVAAAGITWMEPHWITGWQNPDGKPRRLPVVLGCEIAGRVRSLGEGVRGFAVEQDVIGMTEPYHKGALAELACVRASDLMPMPKSLSYEEAATLPLAGLTAWQALRRHGELRQGQRVLIHGGAGGVGTFAIQIAHWLGAHVVVTARSKDAGLCKSLGADEVIDFEHVRFEERGGGYDLVFDQIGGDVQERSWALLKRGGKLISIAGDGTDAPDPSRARDLGVSACFFIVERDIEGLRQLADLVVSGTVRPVIGQRVPFASAAAAFADSTGRLAGKAVMLRPEATLRSRS